MPEELERIVMVLLEKDPANRLPTAGALVALARHIDGSLTPARGAEQQRQAEVGQREERSGPTDLAP